MLDNFKGSLRLLGSLVMIGFQLALPQPSPEHRKVPQRIEGQNAAPEEDTAGIPGVWGSWGPWSACSRSCSGGVMEQTRPCLAGYYPESNSPRPGQNTALGRTFAHLQPHREDPLHPFSGHIVSAIRTSVPLHRNQEPPPPLPPRAAPWPAAISPGSRNDSHWNQVTPRGGRLSPSRRRSPKPERRGRNKSPIGPGMYGYGKVPYILPLQTDTGQSSAQKPRRQRQSMQGAADPLFVHPVSPSHHRGGFYQEDHRSPVVSSSSYQQSRPSVQAFPGSQRLIHGTEHAMHFPVSSHQPIRGQMSPPQATAIVCTGAYRQYRLCNTNVCLENRSIREVQCTSYNNKPFMGRFYEWEPFDEVKGSQKCELNCRAVGYRFYVRQADKVIDGTPCDQNGTSICVSGQCKNGKKSLEEEEDEKINFPAAFGAERLSAEALAGERSAARKAGERAGLGEEKRRRGTKGRAGLVGSLWGIPRPAPRISQPCSFGPKDSDWRLKLPSWVRMAACSLLLAMLTFQVLADAEKKSIGCDDYLGSDKVVDKCGICGGDNTACKVISGVFKHTLTNLGYHKIVEIPEGATKINITEMSKSNNYLALRSRSGRSIINGNWAIDRPGRYEGGGTMFTYKRPNEISTTAGESFLADGPTNEILDVYMIHQQPNPGVHYEYIIPGPNTISSQAPLHRQPGEPFNGQLDVVETVNYEEEDLHRETSSQARQPGRFPPYLPDNQVPVGQPPRRSREHNWKQIGMTQCSATCGKGSQYPIFRCVHRLSHEEVAESHCDLSSRPTPEEEACNIFPCPAFWDIGEWSECSKSCGLGMQHRQVLCRQVYANRTLTVQLHRCQHLERPETTSTCQLKICSEWQIRTEWTSCSVPCGVGQRTRDVKCLSNLGDVVDDEECNMKLRPSDIENCDMGPCAKSWFLTEWSDRCSADCGPGVRTRSVVCMTNHISSLPLEGCGHNRPSEATPCDNGPCLGKVEWFAGSWSQCSVECGSGSQQREVLCIRKTESSFDVLTPYECSFLQRPPDQQTCFLKPCGAKWFSTAWSACSKSCESGFRIREVRCLSDDMSPSTKCDPHLKPEEKETCNTQDCVSEIDENCKDKYYNCNVVVQARLCVYTYYKTACCVSCLRVADRQQGFLGRR